MVKKLKTELEELKKRCNAQSTIEDDDELLQKLSTYHGRLSSTVDNILTEKLSSEVVVVVNDITKVDDVIDVVAGRRTQTERYQRLDETTPYAEQLDVGG